MFRPEGEANRKMGYRGERGQLREKIEKADQQIDQSLEQTKRAQQSHDQWKLKGAKQLEGRELDLRKGS
jgi:hypothetical protein